MTVAEMLRRISALELAEWQAEDRIRAEEDAASGGPRDRGTGWPRG